MKVYFLGNLNTAKGGPKYRTSSLQKALKRIPNESQRIIISQSWQNPRTLLLSLILTPFFVRLHIQNGIRPKRNLKEKIQERLNYLSAMTATKIVFQSEYCLKNFIKTNKSASKWMLTKDYKVILNGAKKGKKTKISNRIVVSGNNRGENANYMISVCDLLQDWGRRNKYNVVFLCEDIEYIINKGFTCMQIEHEDLPSFLANSAFMIHSRINDWCPNILSEALVSDCPCLHAEEGGMREQTLTKYPMYKKIDEDHKIENIEILNFFDEMYTRRDFRKNPNNELNWDAYIINYVDFLRS